MKLRSILIVCCSFLFADSVYAQSVGATADPISGTWKGEMSPHNQNRTAPLIMELKVRRE